MIIQLFFMLFFCELQGNSVFDWLMGQTPAVTAYNNGTVLCRAGDYIAGCEQLDSVAGELQENAQFNRGVAALEQQQWQEACDIYQKILEKNPENIKARKNYDYARKKLEEQKQEQKQEQEQKQNQEDQQEQKSSEEEKKQDPQKKSEEPRPLSSQAAPLAQKLDAHDREQQKKLLAQACSSPAGAGDIQW